tara:strand:- start:708 stop:926 length:219 start_codon:yes stop_codon:yes gene_type:complete
MPGKFYGEINPLEQYLKNREGIIYSVRSMKKELGLSSRKLVYFANQSKHIRQADPIEVGSNKKKFNIYTYQE